MLRNDDPWLVPLLVLSLIGMAGLAALGDGLSVKTVAAMFAVLVGAGMVLSSEMLFWRGADSALPTDTLAAVAGVAILVTTTMLLLFA